MPDKLIDFARNLRKGSTEAEQKIWYFLRDRRLANCKFRRQFPIGNYIVDFICLEKNLIIELDGSQHMDQMAYDDKRTKFLESKGYKVLRFWDNEVFKQTQGILEVIHKELTAPHCI